MTKVLIVRSFKTAAVLLSIASIVVALIATIVLFVNYPEILLVLLSLITVGSIAFFVLIWGYRTVVQAEEQNVPLWRHTLHRLKDIWDAILDVVLYL